MKLKNSRWTMVMVGVIALLVLATMVWASPPASAPSVPLQAYDAKNADKVDGLHASKRPNPLTLLALRKNGKFPASVIPGVITRDGEVMRIVKKNDGSASGLDADLLDGKHASALASSGHNHDDVYLNDDQQETIEAAVEYGHVLTVNNTGSGENVWGLYARAEDMGVYAYSPYGGVGVHGESYSGQGVIAESNLGLPLMVLGSSGDNLIEAWDWGDPIVRRFRVTRSGDVHISALLKVGQYSSAPATCDAAHDGAIALTSGYRMCVCKNGTGWVYTSDGTTSCSW